MGPPAEKRLYSIAEYLKLEEKAKDKHEFHDGEILAMAGGSYEQSRIKTNLIVALGNRLRRGPCAPLDSDMRIRIHRRVDYVYPDASILCGPPEFDPDDRKRTTIVNPRVIFEVLSDSTEAHDRGEKFSLYREIPTMQEYVLISQRRPRVEVFYRQDDGSWLLTHFSELTAVARLRSVEIDLPLAELYTGVDFNPDPGVQHSAASAK